jgi:hypothetical protein
MDRTRTFWTIVELAVLTRTLLLAIAWLTALWTKSPERRETAMSLVQLILTPRWHRGGPAADLTGRPVDDVE